MFECASVFLGRPPRESDGGETAEMMILQSLVHSSDSGISVIIIILLIVVSI